MSDGEPYKSRWFAFEHLSFLEDIRSNQPKGTQNEPFSIATINVAKTEPETESNPENEKEESAAPNSDSERPLATATVWMQDEDETPAETQTITRKRKTIKKFIKKAKRLKSDEYFHKSDNSYDAFGKLVASELRKYDNHTLAHVKKAIMDIIFQADTGNLPVVEIKFNSNN
ncbi:uncharacterized protein LOC119834063 isoform X2 [Zerene cesonia]|uniref:uncharacterized protein LOC119834063 isoform X2 n=1 Tax=Zerene cesonia TaxID=33412 RepID=UPI0018E50E8D|nr:uncharacterized protein LOC119834063 isoform X2 [Zerene cesonia]